MHEHDDDLRGLGAAEASARLRAQGPNELDREKRASMLAVFLRQYRGALVMLLAAACVLSIVLGEVRDAIAIAVILLLNGVVGFVQEWRAESAIAALAAMSAPRARVRRDGHDVVVPAREIVVGDVLVLEAGDIVAADARLRRAHDLEVNEAVLTGESVPSAKRRDDDAREDAPLAERHDRVFMGTSVARGSGRAVVHATGMRTELGKIATLLGSVKRDETPLEARLEKVGRALAVGCLAIVAVVAALGVVRGQEPLEIAMAATSLAVAAVPEGLATIVTLALAIGVTRMAARDVLVRRLQAVETLGCATVVCTDKTGTLTTGVMELRAIEGADEARLLDAAVACCDADVHAGTGDATELAIERAGLARGIARDEIERTRPRTHVAPFDADRKRMSIRRADGVLYVKGALEPMLLVATKVPDGLVLAAETLAARGLRVLAIAIGRGDEEKELEILGVVGIADPPRPAAVSAVAAARRAGVRVVMITGDHRTTAEAIAREMGIVKVGDVAEERVHARATPEDKLRIVRGWKERGEVTAMTGDGVNDAPALREAHIGIAMGQTGTEVTRQAADMILTKDDFSAIVDAIREGRGVFDNIRRALVYLLAGNAAELLVMLGASLVGWPLPLTALELLWINLVTDGLPALALVAEKTPPEVLDERPRGLTEPVIRRVEWTTIALVGALHASVSLGAFAWALSHGRSTEHARALAFLALVVSEVLYAFTARSRTRTLFQLGLFGNRPLFAVVVTTLALQAVVSFVPVVRDAFGIGAVEPMEALELLPLTLVPTTCVEIAKLVRARIARARAARPDPGSRFVPPKRDP
ncbi:MAG: cation-translocating P-type ATPase [Sandaracinus sp.]